MLPGGQAELGMVGLWSCHQGGRCGDAHGGGLTALPAQELLLPETKGLSPHD